MRDLVTMRSDISRKQPPIIAYSDEPVKEYPEMTDDIDSKGSSETGSEDFPVRVSEEMSNAIRRQRRTVGVEYWRHPIAALPPTRHAKRASFQNLFFPSLDMSSLASGNAGRLMRVRSDGTDSKPGVPLFSRSNTTSDMIAPSVRVRVRDQSHSQPIEAKKVVVTDLACLELGDSADPVKSPQLAYFYQLYKAKFRYMDYLECATTSSADNMPLKPGLNDGFDADRVQQFHPRKPVKLTQSMRAMSLPTMTPLRRGGHDQARRPSHNTTSGREQGNKRHDANGFFVDVYSRKPPEKHSLGDSMIHRNRGENRDLAVQGTVFSINHTSSRNHRPVSMAHGALSQQRRTVRSASVPRVQIAKSEPSERTRKRSVHFSISNEVYEYAPTDPVRT